MSQICLSELAVTPATPPTDKVRVYVGPDGILRSIDDAGVVTVYQPANAITSLLQYSNTAAITTTTSTVMSLATDRNSSPGIYFTKVNATDFRANFNGLVAVTYKVHGYMDTNDRGYHVLIRKNGTEQTFTRSYGWTKDRKDRSMSVSGNFILSCAVNDVFTFLLTSLEAALVTVDAGDATTSLRLVKVT